MVIPLALQFGSITAESWLGGIAKPLYVISGFGLWTSCIDLCALLPSSFFQNHLLPIFRHIIISLIDLPLFVYYLWRAICIFHWTGQIWQWPTSEELKNWGLIFVLIKVVRLIPLIFKIYCPIVCLNIDILPGLVRAYLALAKCKDALFTAREAMKVMHQSAKALKLVGDVHAISSSGREKVNFVLPWVIDLQTICSVFLEASSAQLDRCV